jgi:hypothetical protein
MRDNRYCVRLVLIGAGVATLLFAGLWPTTSQAEADENCIRIGSFLTKLARRGGTSTAIPAAGFSKAQVLLRAHGNPRTDAAYFEQMPDGSSGIAFADKGCLSAFWPAPPFVPRSTLKQMLFEVVPLETAHQSIGDSPAIS